MHIFLFCFYGIIISAIHAHHINHINKYGIFIDAGSTGSRLYVYQWNTTNNINKHPHILIYKNQSSHAVVPGISAIASDSNAESIKTGFRSLINFGTDLLHNHSVNNLSSVDLYLGATAGMRVLNHTQCNRIMNFIIDFFTNKTESLFNFKFARIISGEEEAVFGWISINYLFNKLPLISSPYWVSEVTPWITGEVTVTPWVPTKQMTFGAIDMGGASTQITFYPDSNNILTNIYPLRLADKTLNLYAHSFIYYGLKEASKRLNAIIKQRTYNLHPCYPKDFSVFDPNEGIFFNGTSNYKVCADYAYELLEKTTTCLTSECSMAGVYQPTIPKDMPFIAFSGYGYVMQAIDMPPTTTLTELKHMSFKICSMNYTQLNAIYRPNTYLPHLCFYTVYIHSVLNDGYGLGNNQVLFLTTLDIYNIEWTLGAMLYYANTLLD
jgi:Golgi nucleoside diphosphatase